MIHPRLACMALFLAAPVVAQDAKISELPDGSPGQATDAIPIARAGANYRLPFSAFADAITIPPPFTGGQITSPLLTTDGTIDTPGVAFVSEPALGLYHRGAGNLGITGNRIDFFQVEQGTANTASQVDFRLHAHRTQNTTGAFLVYYSANLSRARWGFSANATSLDTDTTADLDLNAQDSIWMFAGDMSTFRVGNGPYGVGTGGFFFNANAALAHNYPVMILNNHGTYASGSYEYLSITPAADSVTIATGASGTGTAPALTIGSMMTLTGIAFASLGTPADGTIAYCSDCVVQSSCAGSGTGALAKRLNGAWVCN